MNQRTSMTIVCAGMYMCCTSGVVNGGGSPYRFAMIDLGDLGGDASNIFAINRDGVAAGSSWLEGNEISHAVLMRVSQEPIDLGTLGGPLSHGGGISALGAIAGWAHDIEGHPKPTLWRQGEMIDLGTLGGSGGFAYDVNSSSIVVGSSTYPGDQDTRPFRWEDGVMFELPSHGRRCEARYINENGQIVGYALALEDPKKRAVLWENGRLSDLPPLHPFRSAEAWAINELGQIVGWSDNENWDGRAVIWDAEGQVHNIQYGVVGIASSVAYGINNLTDVVGYAYMSSGYPRKFGFVWNEHVGMRLLADLVPPNSGLQIDAAFDINDNTEIAARAWQLKDGWYRALLLVPVSPELTLSDPVPGLAGEVNTWTITGARPGSKIIFTYSLQGGGTVVPGCDKLDAVLQINNPKIMKSAVANANGEATIERFVPAQARNVGDILFQAVSLEDCQESQLMVYSFD